MFGVRIHEQIRRAAQTPVYATILTTVTIATGILGALWADVIRGSFPIAGVRGVVAWQGATFWVGTLLSIIMFFTRQSATDASRARAANQLQGIADDLLEKSKDLENLVRTVPARDFMPAYNIGLFSCERAMAQVRGRAASRQDLEAELGPC